MINLKVIVLALVLNLSMSAHAADAGTSNTDNNKRVDSMSDCFGMTGVDRTLCDNELINSRSAPRNDENSRINQNRNVQDNQKLDEMNGNDFNTRDMQAFDNKPKDIKPNDIKPDVNQPNTPNPNNQSRSIKTKPSDLKLKPSNVNSAVKGNTKNSDTSNAK